MLVAALELDKLLIEEFNGEPTSILIQTYNKKYSEYRELLPLSEYPEENTEDEGLEVTYEEIKAASRLLP